MSFPAKILLFGEYTVIDGGEALARPFMDFSGVWEKSSEKIDWNPLLRFLSARPEMEMDLERLEADLGKGLGFVSNIPQGKGLGSSGALVAALFDQYGPKKDWELSEIRTRLAGLEACYHGQSSGIDPLVSWLKKPLLLNGTKQISVLDLPLAEWGSDQRWFLLDSQVSRHSAPLIAVFKQKAQQASFQQALKSLSEMVGVGIKAYRAHEVSEMEKLMCELSSLQLTAFSEMIPESIRKLWLQGLKDKQFALKLCGAGGGGFFLGLRLKGPLPRDTFFI